MYEKKLTRTIQTWKRRIKNLNSDALAEYC
jgi:hypothetical protein